MHKQPEEWRAVPGYIGIYEVSDLGRMRSVTRQVGGAHGSLRTLHGQILKPMTRKDGYIQHTLSKEAQLRPRLIHGLILRTFVGPPPEGHEGCHKDGDRSNNALTNLYWGTRSDNQRDRVQHGNHHLRQRTHCPRNHPLEMPNLVAAYWRKGRRECLACGRTSTNFSYRRRKGLLTLDFQTEADRRYAEILASVQ